ncbi:MAG: DUF4402 domain-containing protein [Pseudomonadota bacterium]
MLAKPLSLILTALLMPVFATGAARADRADAQAGATIAQPIMIMAWEEMLFGRIAPSAVTGGSVVIDTGGARSCSTALTCLSGTYRAAKFSVTGEADALYTITLPDTITLTNGQGASLEVDSLTTPLFTRQLSEGYDEFMIGGELEVAANQPVGTYIGTYIVTVDYA